MYRPRTIDDLLQDTEFTSSEEFRLFQSLVDQGAYASVKEAILSIIERAEDVRREERQSWPEEIRAAVKADKRRRVFPPLHSVASCIRDGDFYSIPMEQWYMLADFLSGEHRNKKGKPRSKFTRQCDKDIADLYNKMTSKGMSPNNAQGGLASTQRLDLRSIQRILKREREREELRELLEKLNGQDINRFFLDDT